MSHLCGAILCRHAIRRLESLVAAPLLWHTRALVNRRMMGVILVAACVCVPLGTLILVSLEPQLMLRAVALTVIVFALMLLIGRRYSGRPRRCGLRCPISSGCSPERTCFRS